MAVMRARDHRDKSRGSQRVIDEARDGARGRGKVAWELDRCDEGIPTALEPNEEMREVGIGQPGIEARIPVYLHVHHDARASDDLTVIRQTAEEIAIVAEISNVSVVCHESSSS